MNFSEMKSNIVPVTKAPRVALGRRDFPKGNR
jgi:hypothetical protein